MKEQFVTYEVALKLKKLGFDEECLAFYVNKNIYPVMQEPAKGSYFNSGVFEETLRAPLWQQVIDFIWEKYHILINTYQISHGDIVWQVIYEFYPTKEQAILKAIELCQNKKF